jgi:hypothetical protein
VGAFGAGSGGWCRGLGGGFGAVRGGGGWCCGVGDFGAGSGGWCCWMGFGSGSGSRRRCGSGDGVRRGGGDGDGDGDGEEDGVGDGRERPGEGVLGGREGAPPVRWPEERWLWYHFVKPWFLAGQYL